MCLQNSMENNITNKNEQNEGYSSSSATTNNASYYYPSDPYNYSANSAACPYPNQNSNSYYSSSYPMPYNQYPTTDAPYPVPTTPLIPYKPNTSLTSYAINSASTPYLNSSCTTPVDNSYFVLPDISRPPPTQVGPTAPPYVPYQYSSTIACSENGLTGPTYSSTDHGELKNKDSTRPRSSKYHQRSDDKSYWRKERDRDKRYSSRDRSESSR